MARGGRGSGERPRGGDASAAFDVPPGRGRRAPRPGASRRSSPGARRPGARSRERPRTAALRSATDRAAAAASPASSCRAAPGTPDLAGPTAHASPPSSPPWPFGGSLRASLWPDGPTHQNRSIPLRSGPKSPRADPREKRCPYPVLPGTRRFHGSLSSPLAPRSSSPAGGRRAKPTAPSSSTGTSRCR